MNKEYKCRVLIRLFTNEVYDRCVQFILFNDTSHRHVYINFIGKQPISFVTHCRIFYTVD